MTCDRVNFQRRIHFVIDDFGRLPSVTVAA